MTSIKNKVLEFAGIAGDCPENLQVVCFELLLKHHLDSLQPGKGKQEKPKAEKSQDSDTEEKDKPSLEESAQSQDDLAAKDLHVRAKRFIQAQGISLDELNNLFYKEDGEIHPLYEDLRTTKMSESQIRVALLQALHQALSSGIFEANIENIRSECKDRKCYSGNNFPANFRNNSSMFDFEEFSKDVTKIKLSEDGRKALAEVIRDLQ